MASLQGRHALVTGGGRGIGRAIAAALTQAGAAVTIAGRNEKALADVVGQGEAAGYVIADVTDAKAVDSGVKQAVAARGPVDLLIANAGIADSAPMGKTDVAPSSGGLMAINFEERGIWHRSTACLPGMVQRGSSAGSSGSHRSPAFKGITLRQRLFRRETWGRGVDPSLALEGAEREHDGQRGLSRLYRHRLVRGASQNQRRCPTGRGGSGRQFSPRKSRSAA